MSEWTIHYLARPICIQQGDGASGVSISYHRERLDKQEKRRNSNKNCLNASMEHHIAMHSSITELNCIIAFMMSFPFIKFKFSIIYIRSNDFDYNFPIHINALKTRILTPTLLLICSIIYHISNSSRNEMQFESKFSNIFFLMNFQIEI